MTTFAQPLAKTWQDPPAGLMENQKQAMEKTEAEARRKRLAAEAHNGGQNIVHMIIWCAAGEPPRRLPLSVSTLPNLLFTQHDDLVQLLSLNTAEHALHCELYSLSSDVEGPAHCSAN
ncbi:hypothetical protein JAAARDRAFT_408429 [Jaapia argillacea MUCL 33604]|uniref:Uncharacterized protein n=1 Tax=Jaapia argillacea MUCL 33604 TaxID=933084 RepID=A0A067P2H4_9AGAM|nr:hypothetical protein JAAARDRAFT_408429 [Jaapia argillacea MUCL 33604]